jgi:hypothetical protein
MDITPKKTEQAHSEPKSPSNFFYLFEWKSENKKINDNSFKILVIIFLFLFLFLLVWQKNFFGSTAVIMVIFTLIIGSGKDEIVECSILREGIKIKKELFPWKNLNSFYIFQDNPEIYIKTKKGILQNIVVPINIEDAEKIRNIINKFIPEKEAQRSFSDLVLKKLGF